MVLSCISRSSLVAVILGCSLIRDPGATALSSSVLREVIGFPDSVCLLARLGTGGHVDGALVYSSSWTRDVPVSDLINQWLGVEGAYWSIYGI